MAYAHATIEDPADGKKYMPGDTVPKKLQGFDELVEQGAISDEEYVPEPSAIAEPNLTNVVEIDENTVEIDGVIYKKTSDSSEAADARA
jgi:hypothetical protein